jgi:hypothetical protein
MTTQNIVVNPDLKAYIDPLTAEEHASLERSLLAEGCRDALVLWGDMLVDGHNRYGICQKHGLPFHTVQNPRFHSIDDVHLWMIDQHLGRRSVSNFQRGLLALRKSDILASRREQAAAVAAASGGGAADADAAAGAGTEASEAPWSGDSTLPAAEPLNSREAIARAARLSSSQVVMIERIQKQAAPEVVAAVRAGTISINAAAAVASLPAEEQVAVAAAGADELKQAAKRVRDATRRPPRDPVAGAEGGDGSDHADASAAAGELTQLRARVAELSAENAALRAELAALR